MGTVKLRYDCALTNPRDFTVRNGRVFYRSDKSLAQLALLRYNAERGACCTVRYYRMNDKSRKSYRDEYHDVLVFTVIGPDYSGDPSPSCIGRIELSAKDWKTGEPVYHCLVVTPINK